MNHRAMMTAVPSGRGASDQSKCRAMDGGMGLFIILLRGGRESKVIDVELTIAEC